jgi:hypothetical protein
MNPILKDVLENGMLSDLAGKKGNEQEYEWTVRELYTIFDIVAERKVSEQESFP